jgi:hypothetical protein
MSQIPPSSLQLIGQLARQDERWLPSAHSAVEFLLKEEWIATHPSAGDWIVDAAQAAGYSVNAFRRQMRVAEFLQQNVDDKTWSDLLSKNIPFGNLEILRRLFDTNPDQAKALLPEVISGERTYRAMRDLYQKTQDINNIQTGRKAYVNRALQFSQIAESCVKLNVQTFVGPQDINVSCEFSSAGKGFFYSSPDLLLLGCSIDRHNVKTFSFADAFEFKMFGVDDSKQILNRTLESASLMEAFFRKIWLIYPRIVPPVDNHEQYIQKLCFHLIALGMDSVGVALVTAEPDPLSERKSTFEVRIFPKPNPNPVRQHLFASHVRRIH